MTKVKNNPPVNVEVIVMIFKEGDYFISYCPALELSSFGKTQEEAKEYFEDALKIFIEDTATKGTLEKCLINLGWKLQKENYEPPRIEKRVDFEKYKDLRFFKESVPFYATC